jgi:hypothetical protein
VVVPSSHQSCPLLLLDAMAPVTDGVPAAGAAPSLSMRVANESGCPVLSRRLRLNHQANLPLRLPRETLACLPASRSLLL